MSNSRLIVVNVQAPMTFEGSALYVCIGFEIYKYGPAVTKG